MQQNFESFLKQNMTWSDFDNLDSHLGISKRAVTMALEDPSRFSKLEMEKISQILSKFNSRFTVEFIEKNFLNTVKA